MPQAFVSDAQDRLQLVNEQLRPMVSRSGVRMMHSTILADSSARGYPPRLTILPGAQTQIDSRANTFIQELGDGLIETTATAEGWRLGKFARHHEKTPPESRTFPGTTAD